MELGEGSLGRAWLLFLRPPSGGFSCTFTDTPYFSQLSPLSHSASDARGRDMLGSLAAIACQLDVHWRCNPLLPGREGRPVFLSRAPAS